MEFIKQKMLSNEIDLSDIDELTEMFILMGNQQEITKVFKVMDRYLSENITKYTIWEIDDLDGLMNIWESEKGLIQDDKGIKESLEKSKKNKKPIFDFHEEVRVMLPIISREEVCGFFCIHEEIIEEEKWKRIYVVSTILSYAVRYYEMVKTIKNFSILDATSGLYNLRHFQQLVQLEVDKSKRFKKPLTLLTLKIKDFDEVNKKLGFEGGEVALKFLSEIIKESVRKTDMPSRINDEIFAVLLYETDEIGAKVLGERIKNITENTPIEYNGYIYKLEIDYKLVEYKKSLTTEEFLTKARNI